VEARKFWKQKILDNFSYFCQAFLDDKYYDAIFHTDLCHFVQSAGNQILIVLPRTFLKTTIVGQMFALWLASRNPSIRILVTSNTTPNAQKTVRSIRSVIEGNPLYRYYFPELIPHFSKVRWSDSCACLNRPEDYPEGTFEAAGIGANIIRRHFNVIIEDDTVAPKKDELTGQEAMPSKEDIEKAIGFHRLTIPLLINEDDIRIVIGTHWASYDLLNYVKENEKFAIYDRKCYLDDGSPLYKRFSLKRLQTIKEGMGMYMFSMLYLNQPLAKEFMAFNPDWFRYYEEDELPKIDETVITIDPADPPTGKKSQDYSAIVSVAHTKKGMYIRRYRRRRLTDGQLIKEGMDMAEMDNAYKIRIETNKYAHLEAGFREEMAKRNKYYSIDAVKAKLIQKEARIKNRLSPLFENGVVYMKKGMRELEEELTTFPHGRHDDLIDALSWQVHRYQATDYPEKSEEKQVIDKNYRQSFTLEEIRKSCRKGHQAPYPFQRQNEYMMPAGRDV